MTGTVLNIQRFCTSDGPGIRTTVFLKGCPLRCLWCHNPESQHRPHELLFDAEKCLHCGKCIPRCPSACHTIDSGRHAYDRSLCLSCGNCISPLCPALEISGREMSADEILAEVEKDLPFYESSGGGMTLSGGEPLSQAELAGELLRGAKARGIHTALETCGYASTEVVRGTAAWTDLYLFDLKESDPMRHRAYTGKDNAEILENLRLLDALGKRIILRCPIIPAYNDREDHFRAIAAIANELSCVERIELEPYHSFGASKYGRLGQRYALSDVKPPENDTVDRYIKEIKTHTTVKVVRA